MSRYQSVPVGTGIEPPPLSREAALWVYDRLYDFLVVRSGWDPADAQEDIRESHPDLFAAWQERTRV